MHDIAVSAHPTSLSRAASRSSRASTCTALHSSFRESSSSLLAATNLPHALASLSTSLAAVAHVWHQGKKTSATTTVPGFFPSRLLRIFPSVERGTAKRPAYRSVPINSSSSSSASPCAAPPAPPSVAMSPSKSPYVIRPRRCAGSASTVRRSNAWRCSFRSTHTSSRPFAAHEESTATTSSRISNFSSRGFAPPHRRWKVSGVMAVNRSAQPPPWMRSTTDVAFCDHVNWGTKRLDFLFFIILSFPEHPSACSANSSSRRMLWYRAPPLLHLV